MDRILQHCGELYATIWIPSQVTVFQIANIYIPKYKIIVNRTDFSQIQSHRYIVAMLPY